MLNYFERGLVPDWIRIGSGLDPDWIRIGSGLVPDWFRIGSGLDPDWRIDLQPGLDWFRVQNSQSIATSNPDPCPPLL